MCRSISRQNLTHINPAIWRGFLLSAISPTSNRCGITLHLWERRDGESFPLSLDGSTIEICESSINLFWGGAFGISVGNGRPGPTSQPELLMPGVGVKGGIARFNSRMIGLLLTVVTAFAIARLKISTSIWITDIALVVVIISMRIIFTLKSLVI